MCFSHVAGQVIRFYCNYEKSYFLDFYDLLRTPCMRLRIYGGLRCVCVYINEARKGRACLLWMQTAVKRDLANPPPYVLGAFHTTTEPDFRPP